MKSKILALSLSLGMILQGTTAAFAATPNEQIDTLKSLIDSAKAQNIDVRREQMTVQLAELFLGWAAWDDANQETNVQFYLDHPTYKNNASTLAAELGQFERESVSTVLENAIDEFKEVLNGNIVRKPAPFVDFSEVKIKDGEFRAMDDQSVFLSSYTWKPSDEFTNPYFGNLNSGYISPSFIIDEQGNTQQWRLNNIANDNDSRIGQIFINHNAIPQWIIDKYPDIQDKSRLFSKYLIDNPGAKELFSRFFQTYIPLLKDKRSTDLGYMLFNEPSFFTEAGVWNTGGVSEQAIQKFQTWLSTTHGDIATLNNLWDSNYGSFNDINIPLPMNSQLKGTALWYDWMRFNQIRVTDWFTFLDAEIKKYDTDAKTHIKLMPWLWNESSRSHGLDFESLLNLTDIIGFDANSEYLSHRTNNPWYQQEYSFDWQSATLSFDFFSSIQPDQVMWDSENHFFNKGAFQIKDVEPNYVRAIYWLAATHGLDGVSTWMWARNTDGSIIENRGHSSEYITGVTHQPLGFHELTRTIMDINAHHNDIVKLQKQDKEIRIFYSETSAITQNNYMDSIRDAHRTLFFEGMALGFATQNIIENHTQDWSVIVVKDTQHVTPQELAALKNYVDNGGTILTDNDSLQKDQYGRNHATPLLPSGDNVIRYNTTEELLSKTLELANSKNILPSINLTESNNQALKKVAWRIKANQIENEDSYTVSMVNTAKTAINIDIKALADNHNIELTNLMTGQAIDSSINLAVRETLLLKANLVEKEPEPTPPPTSPTPEPSPTPAPSQPAASNGAGGASGWLIALGLLGLLRKELKQGA